MADMTNEGASELAYLPPTTPPTNHGHTTAAWVTTLFVLVGVLTAAIGVIAALVWLFWVGIGIAVVGVIAGKVLSVLGFGQPAPEQRSSGGVA